MKRASWAIAAAVALAACADVSEERLSRLEPGKTTAAEVVAAFGSPDRDSRLSDGTRILFYDGAKVRNKPQAFLPLIGHFLDAKAVSTDEAALKFSADDRFQLYTWSSSRTGAIMGVSTGGKK
jgi:hypothetical protein